MTKIRTAQLAKIHIAKKDLGIDDDTYRSILWSRFEANSASDLNETQRDDLIEYFKTKGWVEKPKRASKKASKIDEPDTQKRKYLQVIRNLLIDLDKGPEYADGMSLQMFNQPRYIWCTTEQLHKLAQALRIHLRRHAKNGGKES